jgi:hypothetical protein
MYSAVSQSDELHLVLGGRRHDGRQHHIAWIVPVPRRGAIGVVRSQDAAINAIVARDDARP